MKEEDFPNKNTILNFTKISDIDVYYFVQQFNLPLSEKAIIDFICDGDNAYELQKFGTRYSELASANHYTNEEIYNAAESGKLKIIK